MSIEGNVPVSAWRDDWAEVRNVLAVRLDGMGDLVMTSPALRLLKCSRPGRRLTLLTSPAGAAAAELIPEVDEVLIFEAPWMKATGTSDPAEGRDMISRLAVHRFDAAVIFTVYSQSPLPAAHMLHLAGVPKSLAYCREKPYGLLSHHVPESEPEKGVRHEVRRHLDLVELVAGPVRDPRIRLQPRRSARQRIARLLAHLGLAGTRDWFLVHPGATAPSRRYPPESYAAAVRILVEEHGLTPVYTGSAGERSLVDKVRGASKVTGIDLSGGLDLHELTALIASAPVILTNNTGPAHLAAGTGTPIVDLYALTNPQHTPWMVPAKVLSNDVPCRNCYRSECPLGHNACLRGIPPRDVAVAVVELLALGEQVPVERQDDTVAVL